MSSQTYDFHSVCIVCRGNDCDRDNLCSECTAVDDATLTAYLKHKLSLQRKLHNKHKAKDLTSTPAPVHDVVDPVMSSD